MELHVYQAARPSAYGVVVSTGRSQHSEHVSTLETPTHKPVLFIGERWANTGRPGIMIDKSDMDRKDATPAANISSVGTKEPDCDAATMLALAQHGRIWYALRGSREGRMQTSANRRAAFKPLANTEARFFVARKRPSPAGNLLRTPSSGVAKPWAREGFAACI